MKIITPAEIKMYKNEWSGLPPMLRSITLRIWSVSMRTAAAPVKSEIRKSRKGIAATKPKRKWPDTSMMRFVKEYSW